MTMFTAEYSYELELEASKEDGIREGIIQGFEKGSYDTKIEAARRCLAIRMPIETISTITGLASEEIVKIKT
ncbi:MAG: hypothetical protein ACTTKH_06600 [Treponema sp.]